jgi:phosphinothricin acetyltransferase
MRVRDAREADLPAIVAIYNSTVPGRMVTADTEPVTVDCRIAWFRDHGRKRPLWVVEDRDEVIAWLSFQPFYGRPAYDATAEVSVYVAEAQRKKGIGGMLLRRAIDQGPVLGIKTLVGFIFAHNEPSLRLFKACGFERWGYLPGVAELDGIERDLIILGRRL